ncbi:Rha family transcriptional regulator [Campylobacter sp. RM16188]|uniref:Rha family transcriptional regulator n=1 Tax=Campylobacter sp. RM16188 TaxID=1705725 RepID=UPI0015518CBD|nr:Rha family transcriptional regulator [Campylobacter sp. RM16188]
MNSVVVINNQEVNFEVVGSEAFTTSLDVSAVFGKQHQHIIAKIKSISDENFRQSNFRPSNRVAISGLFEKEQPYYKISKNGAAFLIMGFTGEKAEAFKIQFLEAYDKVLKENQRIKQHFAIGKEQFDQALTALSQKSIEVDEFKQKYYATLERENELLREKLTNKPELIKKSTRLSDAERDEIVKLYKSGLSQTEICRKTSRSDTAVRNAIRSAL